MKRFFFLLLALVTLTVAAQSRAKYVFYFIGDGMGVNQVNGIETWRGAQEGRIGIKPLCFPSFPYVALVNTQSGTNGVTDSAAAGTALATGKKSKNGCLGLEADGATPCSSVACWAKAAGAAVGVTTSVSVDHATPAAFYAHVASRNDYYEIGKSLTQTGFDFFAGSDFLNPTSKADSTAPDLYQQCERAGYVIARGYADFQKKQKKARRLILLQEEAASAIDRSALPYALDRPEGALTLSEITAAGTEYLAAKKGAKGFFLMVEGGKIDWACHANDAATVLRETEDMDDAVRVAYEFYLRHPDETLIVVTADHETGGLALGTGKYELHLDVLSHQRLSAGAYTHHLVALQKELGEGFTWEAVRRDLTEYWGFGEKVQISDGAWKELQNAFEAHLRGQEKGNQSMYTTVGGIAEVARRTMQRAAHVSWASGGHSNGYVPCFAIGAGAELFHGRMDNTEIAPAIARAAGWKMF